jgi:uncharacterized protein
MNSASLPFSPEHQTLLREVARKSIEHGLRESQALPINPADYPRELQIPRAAFVTLLIGHALRGCIGTLEASQPLVVNVAQYAYSAAFRDPRFSALVDDELPQLHYEISILSPLEPIACESEAGLIAQVRPGIDGLLLEEDYHRATLLPSVWKNIPQPQEFLHQLKRKAGLPMDYWSDRLRLRRYTTFSI